jgi:hypothetical protein
MVRVPLPLVWDSEHPAHIKFKEGMVKEIKGITKKDTEKKWADLDEKQQTGLAIKYHGNADIVKTWGKKGTPVPVAVKRRKTIDEILGKDLKAQEKDKKLVKRR